MQPHLSIIIVNYQNWPLLKQCLEALQGIHWLEVIVVDNHSPDDRLEEFCKLFPDFKFIKNTGNNGFAHGCNLGAKSAKADLLLFLNPDAVASEKLLSELVKNYNSIDDLAILGVVQLNKAGKVQAYEKPFPSFSTILGWTRAVVQKLKFRSKVMLAPLVQEVPWVSGAAVCISRAWYEKIGGWDESFWMYFEDTALSKTAYIKGGKVGILLEPKLLHSHGGSSRINPATTALTKLEVMISRHVYVQKYSAKIWRVATQSLAVFNHLIIGLIQLIFGFLLFWTPKGKAYILLFKNLLAYYWQALKKKSWKSPRAID